MNEVKRLSKHIIYYFCDDKIKYYINVPYKEFNVTNICLEFLEETSKFDPEINDIEYVKQNIIDYYKQVDDDNITLVMPILKEEEKNMFLSLNVNKLNIIERIMALYINSSYFSLIKNKITVNKEVFLIENDKYINFIKYFKDKHNSRIVVKRLIEISNESIENVMIVENDNNYINDNKDNDDKDNDSNVPFSLNENILNDVINLNNVIEKRNDNQPEIEKNIEIDNEIKNNKKNIDNIIENNKETVMEPLSKEKNEVKKEIKKMPITEIKKETTIEKKDANAINNVINISDLGGLTQAGLNGVLPPNVTINIEKLVSENKKENKEQLKEDNEVSELDEDISDIDEFDENEDFDIDAIDVSEAVLSNDDGSKNYRTITSGGVKFVVGKKDDENLKEMKLTKNTNNLNLDEQKLDIEMPTNIIKGEDQINKNAGFASYFTLFFVSISAIFLIVYIIIK